MRKLFITSCWRGKRARIAMSTLCKNKQQGGLRLVDLSAKQKALQIKWVFLVENDRFLEECMYENLSNTLRHNIWKCNLKTNDAKRLFQPSHWTNVLLAWCEINFVENPVSKEHVLSQCLWYNSALKINGLPILFKNWFERGILYVRDIGKPTGGYPRTYRI